VPPGGFVRTAVRGRGLLVGAVLDRPANEVVTACRGRGLVVLAAGDDVVRLAPPLVVGPSETAEALTLLGAVLEKTSPHILLESRIV
jgi:acetylornithine/succinyldiaminopimelate/putrescine aminotransferase